MAKTERLKYSLITKAYLEELDRKEPGIKHKMITWGSCEHMENLFILFGGDRDEIRERTGCVGHHFRYKFVMDRLDRESKKPGAIFEKCFIHYSGIIKRPTRCFKLKEIEYEQDRTASDQDHTRPERKA